MITNIALLLMIAAFVGIIRPYVKNWSRKRFVALFCACFVIAVAFVPEPTPQQKAQYEKERAEEEKQDKIRKAAKDKEAAEAELGQKKALARQLLGQLAKNSIRDAARNPDSVIFDGIWVDENSTLVCVSYRAQNGFGGMNRETVAFNNGTPTQSSKFWNNHCTKSLYEVS